MALRGYKPKTKPAMWRSVHPQPPVVTVRKYINPVSKGLAGKKVLYRALAAEFMEREIKAGKTCPVVAAVPALRNGMKYGHPISNKLNDTHHFYGRLGRLLLAQWSWQALSKQGHRWVHENIEEARKLGFICKAGLWNNYEAAKADAIKRGWLQP